MRRGTQSYPLAIGGKLFVTTNDDNVFALDGGTGKVLWRCKPPNSALFKNFGIVANRGLAYCDGRLFIAQLDMKLVALRPGTARCGCRSPPPCRGASTNYGYSETSAPICANHHVLVGAAGSEYGIRGFVMAYTTDLRPAWPSPFWTIPPEPPAGGARLASSAAGSSGRPLLSTPARTPFTSALDRRRRCTSRRCGPARPRGRTRWWPSTWRPGASSGGSSRSPAISGHTTSRSRHSSTGGRWEARCTTSSRWRRWRASGSRSMLTGSPFHERVKVIDRVEHPPLRPGEPVTVFPSSLGGLNYSPASYDPATNYVFNAAAETAAVLVQQKLTPTQKRRKLLLGDVYLGLQNGNFGGALAGWHDHGSISAIDVSSGKRVWKFRTPEPERGGVTTTASGLGFAGGGDGVLRAFDLRKGKVLWTFKTGNPIASGPTIFAAGGREYSRSRSAGRPRRPMEGLPRNSSSSRSGRARTARTTQSVQPAAAWHRDWRARAQCPPHARGNRWRRSDHRQRRRRPARALASRQLERSHRRRAPRSARQACRWRRRRGRPLPAAQEDRRPGSLLRARGLDARPSAPNPCRGRLPCNRGRAPADRRREEDVESRLGRMWSVGYRLVGLRAKPSSARDVFVTGRAVRRRWCPRPRGRPALVSPAGDDHGREREPRARRDRRHEDNRSRLLDVLRAFQRERPLRPPTSPPPTRPGATRSIVERPGRVGQRLVGLRRPQRVVLATAQRHDGRETALDRYDARPPGVDTEEGVSIVGCSWAPRDRRSDQAARGALAGRRWALFAASALECPRQDPEVLGKRLRIVLALSGDTGRRSRSPQLADQALATRRTRRRIPRSPPLRLGRRAFCTKLPD